MSTLKVNSIQPLEEGTKVEINNVEIVGSLSTTGVVAVTGSLIVSGGNTFVNAGPADFVGNIRLGTGTVVDNQAIYDSPIFTDNGSFAHGEYVSATNRSQVHGFNTSASGLFSHAKGITTKAIGNFSHTEGSNTLALGLACHAEGAFTTASNENLSGTCGPVFGPSHAEGGYTFASASYSHAEGYATITKGRYSHAEGNSTQTVGEFSHAEGYWTQTLGSASQDKQKP